MPRTAQVLLGNGGAAYYRATDSSGVGTGSFTTIPSVMSISLPTAEREEIDVTDLDSTGNYKEFKLGDIDPGTSTLKIHLNPSNSVHTTLVAAAEASSDTLYEFKATVNDQNSTARVKVWRARIVNAETSEITRNQPLELTFNLRNSGAPDAWTT